MATKTFKIGLSNTDKQNMAQDVYERLLALTFPEYETSETYAVGDFVVYNDQLYKCIGATSGAWDSTKWQLATLNDLLTDIESAVAFVNDKANVDGNYPTLTAGLADNLTPYSEDSGAEQDNPFMRKYNLLEQVRDVDMEIDELCMNYVLENYEENLYSNYAWTEKDKDNVVIRMLVGYGDDAYYDSVKVSVNELLGNK